MKARKRVFGGGTFCRADVAADKDDARAAGRSRDVGPGATAEDDKAPLRLTASSGALLFFHVGLLHGTILQVMLECPMQVVKAMEQTVMRFDAGSIEIADGFFFGQVIHHLVDVGSGLINCQKGKKFLLSA